MDGSGRAVDSGSRSGRQRGRPSCRAQVVDGFAHGRVLPTAAPMRLTAWMTVVWLRPPMPRPISGRLWSVSSRARYIATWRAEATAGRRSRARASLRRRRTPAAVASRISVMLAGAQRWACRRAGRARGARARASAPRRAAMRRRPRGSARPRAPGRCSSTARAISASTSSGDLDAVEARALGEDGARGRRSRAARAPPRARSGSAPTGAPRGPGARPGHGRRSCTSCRPESSSALKVWKNSSRVRSLRRGTGRRRSGPRPPCGSGP